MSKIADAWKQLRPSIIRELQYHYEDPRYKPFAPAEVATYRDLLAEWNELQHGAPADDADRSALADARHLIRESLLISDAPHTTKTCEEIARTATLSQVFRLEALQRLRRIREFVPFNAEVEKLIQGIEKA